MKKLLLAALLLSSFALLSGCRSANYYVHGRGQFIISNQTIQTIPPLQTLENNPHAH